MEKISFITQIEHVDLAQLISNSPGSETTFKILDSNTIEVTIVK
ncbi:hypothetical protein [Turicibacter sp.]|nr:hypothetical protein [Turicibacter sp.]